MLYILPPPRGPSPPSPWDSILCSTGVNTDSQNITDKPPWDSTKLNTRHPPRIRLRTLRLNKANDGFSGVGADEVDTGRSTSLSECYFAGKGTALVLPAEAQKSSRQTEAQGSNIQKHLQSMFYLLRPEETLKMAVKLESVHSSRTRYLVVVSRMGRKAEESCLLGIDCNEKTTVGLVLRVLADTAITLDGDGGFSFAVCGRHHIFKPVSVQAMWSALQTLHKASSKAREENYFQGGLSHDWVDYYERRIESDRSCLNEWHAMGDLESRRPPSPDSVRTKPRERDETEKVIRSTLKEIMMSVDLDEVTSKYIRNRLEEELDMDLGEYKSFIDQEMLTILGQMDAPTEIFDHVYLGSEWNASNYEELKRNGVRHILNVTREIDNFFPGTFDYLNIRVYDDEKTDLLKYWDNTYKYISKAQQEGSKVLVHCKMGVSRSASVVIAYAMKAYNWDFKTAMQHVKEKRTCIKPNTSFVSQLETYQGILDAMKNKEKLQRSKSETNLKSPGDTSERSLPPGSQPTPLLQALSRSALLSTTMSGQDLHQLGDRPKSWSPDNTRAKEILSDKIFPFRSLENLPKGDTLRRHKSLLKLLQKDLVRNVLLPCDNGESYSVSPNQIRHLPGDAERTTATVKQMVNEFESNAKDTRKKLVLNLVAPNDDENSKLSSPVAEEDLASTTTKPTPPMLRAVLVKKEIWDPGEKPPNKVVMVSYPHDNNACDLKFSVNDNIENRTMWTSSTVLQSEDGPNRDAVPFSNNIEVPDKPKDGDPFSNQLDRVFDREERKQQRISTVVPLLQPTPILLSENTNLPSRECPSRQSSWGSYDSAVVLGYQSETRESPSRHSSLGSGDTRTLPSRNSSWGSYDMRFGFPVYYMNEKGEKILHDDSTKKSESPPTFVVEAVNLALVQDNVSSATSSEIDIVNAKSGNFNSCNNRLSVSAPERCSLGSLPQECSLSRSASVGKTDKDSNVIIKAQCHSVKDHKVFRENVGKDSNAIFNKRAEDSIESDHNAGLVRSLKKEFEAKTNHLEIAQNGSSKSKSLPSSPHSVHVEKDRHDLRFIGSDTTREDFSFKKLIGKFEAKENQESLRPQSKAQRFSCIEVSSEKNNPIRVLQTSLISCYEKSLDQTKRPPVAPVVKNPSPNVVVATVITKATMKQQQFGKTHPLARINIKPLYNTM